MNFVTSVFKKYIKNETQQEDEKASKLLAEPPGQKPRRSVLKEFDPFAPDSPFPKNQKVKGPPSLIDEEDIFEDAETSLTSFKLPRNTNSSNNIEKTPNKINGTSLLIPDLDVCNQEEAKNLNETTDLSYKEAIENLSQVGGLPSMDQTSSEEDFEFNIQINTKNPEVKIQSAENNLLNFTTDVEKTDSFHNDNIMVDSLEQTFDISSKQSNSTITNISSSMIQNKASEAFFEENPISDHVSQPRNESDFPEVNGKEHGAHSMVDSLEMSSQPIHVSDTISEKQFVSNQESLIDSLEILKSAENREILTTNKTSTTSEVQNIDDAIVLVGNSVDPPVLNAVSNNHEAPKLDKTVEALLNQIDLSITENSAQGINSAEINRTFETTETQMTSHLDTSCIAERLVVLVTEIIGDTERSEGDEIQTNKTDIIEKQSELNGTFEISCTQERMPVEQNSNEIISSRSISDNVNVESNKTFEAPSLDSLDSTNHQAESDQIKTSKPNVEPDAVLETNSEQTEILLEKSINKEKMNKTVDIEENKLLIETKQNELTEFVTQEEREQQNKNNDLNKTFDKPLNNIETATSETVTSKVISNTTELNKTEEFLEHIEEQTIQSGEQMAKQESISIQSITNEINIASPKIQETGLEVRIEPFLPSNSENINSTYISEEQTVESSREMETLAQSLNQTIDVEESAIADDINSSKSNTSEDLNLTIENVQEVTESNEGTKCEQTADIGKSCIKTLERKETEEFEDIERQYNEKAQNGSTCVDSPEIIIGKVSEVGVDQAVEQDRNKIYQRQDTQEFEILEQKCKEDMQDLNKCNVKEVNNIGVEKTIEEEKESKVLKRQETEEFEDLERKCKANIETPIEVPNASKLNEETRLESDVTMTVEKKEDQIPNMSITTAEKEPVNNEILMEQTYIPVKQVTEQVKVKVSGNICMASSICEDFEHVDTKNTFEKPLTDINNDKESLNHTKDQNNIEDTVNDDDKQNRSKTDKVKTIEKVVKTQNKPECRPSIRSMRNKTQVIDKPILLHDLSDEVSLEKGDNDLAEKQLNEYKTKNDKLKNEVDRLQIEIDTIKKENMRKDKFILTKALDIEVEKNTNIRLMKLIKEYEQQIAYQTTELERLKEEAKMNSQRFTSSEMAFADLFQKYEKTKSVIVAYKKNEEVLQGNIQSAEDQLTKLEAKCSVMKEQFAERLKKAQEQVQQEQDTYKHELNKLQTIVKRLEIKASSLEFKLKQKTEECQQLSALCDDLAGKHI